MGTKKGGARKGAKVAGSRLAYDDTKQELKERKKKARKKLRDYEDSEEYPRDIKKFRAMSKWMPLWKEYQDIRKLEKEIKDGDAVSWMLRQIGLK